MMKVERRLRVFLSHASEDKQLVRKLAQRMLKQGFDPWVDENSIPAGGRWERYIEQSLRDSDAVVVCLSRSLTGKTGFIHREISLAASMARENEEDHVSKLIPVKLEECNIPEDLSEWQVVDVSSRGGWKALVRALSLRQLALGILDPAPRRRIDQHHLMLSVRRDGRNARCSSTVYYDIPWEQFGYTKQADKWQRELMQDVALDESLFINPVVDRALAESIERMLSEVCGTGDTEVSGQERTINTSATDGIYVSSDFVLSPKIPSRIVMSRLPKLGINLIEFSGDFSTQELSMSVAKATGDHRYVEDEYEEQEWDFRTARELFHSPGFRAIKMAVSKWIRRAMDLRGVDGQGCEIDVSLDDTETDYPTILFTW